MARRTIYVESFVRADPEMLWRVTQTPEHHQRWDLRFSRIQPVSNDGQKSHRFTYSTTVIPGFTISGLGTHMGDRHRTDGSATSSLRFASRQRRSLIREGAGYWRYVANDSGVRFITGYHYTPR